MTLVAGCTSAPVSSISNHWDPRSGRGTITVNTADGGRVEVQLHRGFEGYSGGLVLGGYNSSGYRFWPAGAGDQDEPLAVWCAQDESIFLTATGQELTYGWSENFGRGPDGVLLRYLGGRVLRQEKDALVLASANAADPLQVDRFLLVTPNAELLFRVVVSNISEQPVAFDFWTGDDSWVGRYGTAEGDVGWTSQGFVLNESRAGLAPGRCLGMADTRPGAAPVRALSANAFCLSPTAPAPSAVFFANGFAHDDSEIDAARPLTGDTATGFNVGWKGISLSPGERFEIGYALARAGVDETGKPIEPTISEAAWAELSSQLAPIVSASNKRQDPLRFSSERVELEVLQNQEEVVIRGAYRFENRSDKPLWRRIYFPFAVDEAHPFPFDIRLSAGRPSRQRDGILFPLELDIREKKTVEITYRQRATDSTATYIVTSARMWSEPLDLAEFVVVAPLTLGPLVVSYPMSAPVREGAKLVRRAMIERFFPDRELVVSWGARQNEANSITGPSL